MTVAHEDALDLPDGTGNCYEVAVELVWASPDLVLCHGTPTGRGKIAGIRYGHAWVERAGFAIDKSNGLDVMLPVEIYYAIGNIDPDEVRRFTHADVREMMMHFGHYGPWDGSCPPDLSWVQERKRADRQRKAQKARAKTKRR